MQPEKQITLGGRVFRLRYSLRAFAALQAHFGTESLVETVARVTDISKLDTLDMAVMFWSGCLSHHPDLTPEEVIALIDAEGFQGIAAALDMSLKASLPPASEGDAEDARDNPGDDPDSAGPPPAAAA